MKNIETILTEAGITITDEQKAAIGKAVAENYKTVNEFTTKVEKLQNDRDSWKNQYEGAKASLDKFDGTDIDALRQQIADAQKKAQDAEENARQQLADRDYADAVKAAAADTRFSSEAARRDFLAQLGAKKLPVSDGKLLGYSDFLAGYKEANPGALVDEEAGKKATFTQPNGPGNPSTDPQKAEARREWRRAMGIKEDDKKG